jgi:hypothetical protein
MARKRRQGRETYRRNRRHHIARTTAYHAAQAGAGVCENCEQPAKRRVWVRSGSWTGRMCGRCTMETRRAGVELVLMDRRNAPGAKLGS